MKRVVFFFSLAMSLNASYEINLQNAVTQAQRQNKEILYFVLSNECIWCKQYFNTISANEEIREKIVNNYIIVIKNLSEGQEVDRQMPFYGITPTTIRVDKYGKATYYIEGALKAEEIEIFIRGQE